MMTVPERSPMALAVDALLMAEAGLAAGVDEAVSRAFRDVYEPSWTAMANAAGVAAGQTAVDLGVRPNTRAWRTMGACVAATLEAASAEVSRTMSGQAMLTAALLERLVDVTGVDAGTLCREALQAVEAHGG